MLRDWIDARHLAPQAIKRRAVQFRGARPFPHLLLRDLLRADVIDRLELSISRVALERKESDLFSLWQSGDLSASKDAFLCTFMAFLKSDCLREFLEMMTDAPLASGVVDCAVTRYDDCDYLLCHDDRLEGRKLAYILYLGDSFTIQDGGALCLYDSDGRGRPRDVVKRYPPRRNTLAIFLVSRKSHHAVSENISAKKRIAVSGWFHGR